jgi:hypothetical protein
MRIREKKLGSNKWPSCAAQRETTEFHSADGREWRRESERGEGEKDREEKRRSVFVWLAV